MAAAVNGVDLLALIVGVALVVGNFIYEGRQR